MDISGANLRKKMKAALTVIGLFRERNVCRFEAAAWDGERCVTPARAAAKETTNLQPKQNIRTEMCTVLCAIYTLISDISLILFSLL